MLREKQANRKTGHIYTGTTNTAFEISSKNKLKNPFYRYLHPYFYSTEHSPS
jgi:hypothetical protein